MKSRLFMLGVVTLIVVAAFGLWMWHRPTEHREVKDNKAPANFNVAIVSIVEIEPIAQLRSGFKEVFLASELARKKNVLVTEYNAQGDSGLINQIVDKLVSERPDLIYALGTPVAQAVQKRDPDLLLLQGAVTDPVEAGLAKSWEGSGRKYIATSDLPPIPKQVDLIAELTPNVKRLGIIYNPGEANSVAVVSRLRDYIKRKNLDWQLIERPVGSTSEVATATQSLLGRIDGLYLPPDNTAHAAIPLIGRFARENKIPFYATVSSALDEGAVATLALDFAQVGRESAMLALSVLKGQDPGTTPIMLNENPEISISKKTAGELGLSIDKFRSRTNVHIK